ncbi:GNAT family N-acetyltransferase [Undibacterium sp.]|uniref:GNAT family N-acetyltransferase n=1 Tax=Undibacterium sp. TaxID=1914977 RepID=UPI00374CBC21
MTSLLAYAAAAPNGALLEAEYRPAVHVRPALPADAVAVCEVLRRSIRECCFPDHGSNPQILARWLDNKTPQTVAGWFSSPANCSLVAVSEAGIHGVGLLTGAGKLALCYVQPELLGTGIGSALLRRMEQQASDWELPFVSIDSTVTARDFYIRHGYHAGGMSKIKSGIQAVSLWKYLDDGKAPNQPVAKRGRPCLCGLASQ